MARDPYDGKPYFCTTCGEFLNPADCDDGGCQIESQEAATFRAARKRPIGSDLAAQEKASKDAA